MMGPLSPGIRGASPAVLLLALLPGFSPLHARKPQPNFWHESFEKGMNQARKHQHPVLLYFALPTVHLSNQVYVELTEDPEIVRHLLPFERIRLEAPDLGIAVARFGVDAFPAMVMLDRYEREVGRIRFPQAARTWRVQLMALCDVATRPVPPRITKMPAPGPHGVNGLAARSDRDHDDIELAAAPAPPGERPSRRLIYQFRAPRTLDPGPYQGSRGNLGWSGPDGPSTGGPGAETDGTGLFRSLATGIKDLVNGGIAIPQGVAEKVTPSPMIEARAGAGRDRTSSKAPAAKRPVGRRAAGRAASPGSRRITRLERVPAPMAVTGQQRHVEPGIQETRKDGGRRRTTRSSLPASGAPDSPSLRPGTPSPVRAARSKPGANTGAKARTPAKPSRAVRPAVPSRRRAGVDRPVPGKVPAKAAPDRSGKTSFGETARRFLRRILGREN